MIPQKTTDGCDDHVGSTAEGLVHEEKTMSGATDMPYSIAAVGPFAMALSEMVETVLMTVKVYSVGPYSRMDTGRVS
jgi:hypothetical protein